MNQLEPKGLICGIKKVSNFALSKKSCVIRNRLKDPPRVVSTLKTFFIMPVWKITAKRANSSSALKMEPGMNVEIVTDISTPLTQTISQAQIIDAFHAKYGDRYPMDKAALKSYVSNGSFYLDAVKL